MELRDRGVPLTLFSPEAIVAGHSLTLGEEESHHARVRRVDAGHPVRVVDGCGTVAQGILVQLTTSQATVQIESVEVVEAPPAVHVLVPVADRDRMLLLAEKAAELGAASWRPVVWRRSLSVSSRGQGASLERKVRTRMISALKQSGGAWLPTVYPDATPEQAIAAAPDGERRLLDGTGEPLMSMAPLSSAVLAVGPEGGLEAAERAALLSAGFVAVSLVRATLRFETAGIVALGVIRAAGDAIIRPEERNG